MTFDDFKASINQDDPPAGISEALLALWFDGRGDWDAAHETAQEIETNDGSWIHAYLHRKEGDISNASYWYSRAGKTCPDIHLDDEWDDLVKELL